jgi:hypothetical protein
MAIPNSFHKLPDVSVHIIQGPLLVKHYFTHYFTHLDRYAP